MRIKVMKFGGTSLNSSNKRKMIAEKVRVALREGYTPVIVVSAMGRKGDSYATDTLLGLVGRSKILDSDRAILASCGEIISSAVLTATLSDSGIKAKALSGGQAGVHVVNGYINGRISSVNPRILMSWIRRGYVPVVAGFQGITSSGETAVISRGGSDVSAAAIGTFLFADRVEIYTDVPGIMTADPDIVPDAILLPRLSYDEAFTMAKHGANVIHAEAIKWAKLGDLPLYIGSLTEPELGTKITNINNSPDSNVAVVSNQYDSENVVISVIGPNKYIPFAIERLNTNNIPVYQLTEETNCISLIIPRQVAEHAIRLLHKSVIKLVTKQTV